LTLNYYLKILWHKLLRNNVIILDKTGECTVTLTKDTICKFCTRTIKEVALRPIINLKKEVAFACDECMKKEMNR